MIMVLWSDIELINDPIGDVLLLIDWMQFEMKSKGEIWICRWKFDPMIIEVQIRFILLHDILQKHVWKKQIGISWDEKFDSIIAIDLHFYLLFILIEN